jgi:hypothetical protein
MAQSLTPMEDVMRAKVWSRLPGDTSGHKLTADQLTEAFKPKTLEIHNDSHLHSHHKAMQGVTSKEVLVSNRVACHNG